MSLMRHCGVFLPLIIQSFWPAPLSADSLRVDTQATQQTLAEHLEVLQDPSASLVLDDILSMPDEAFHRPGGNIGNYGFTSSAYWFRLKLDNPGQSRQKLLLIETPWLDNIQLYTPDAGSYRQRVAGDTLPFTARDYDHQDFVFPLHLPAGTSTIYLRVQTDDPFMVPISLYTAEAFHQRDRKLAYYYGLFYGALLIMFLYNAFLYLSLRDNSYLFYCIYLLSFLLMNLSYNGFTYPLLWPDSPRLMNDFYPLMIYLFQVTGLLFAISFLQTRTRLPGLHRVLRGFVFLLLAALLITGLTRDHMLMNATAIYLVLIYAPLVAVAGFAALASGFRAARFFIAASLATLVGASVTAMTASGLLPYSFAAFHAAEFGILVDITLLSLALADRINIMHTEKEQAQQQLIAHEQEARHNLHSANETLEQKVAERTRELEFAKELAEMQARTDFLTGLNNRHAFEETAVTEISRAHRYGHPLSLVVFDLDRFKEINDEYGHAAGDTVLFTVAQTARMELRDSDVLGRLGGEEFAVLLPGIGLEAGLTTAERLRIALEENAADYGDHDVPFTASFGVTALYESDRTLDSLLQRADQAMYRAKQQGRNRVCAG
jgi:diguanylate cyclase (GGDEF)-like protein